jgi:hypothetical protein
LLVLGRPERSPYSTDSQTSLETWMSFENRYPA